MMQRLCALRRWLRGLEPRVRNHLGNSPFAHLQPWLERRALFRFQRQPLALGVAAGLFCGLIPGPLQIPGTLGVCAWLRGNVVAGAVATFYTNPLTIMPLYVLAFHMGALVMPGEQTLPAWSPEGGSFSVEAMGGWMQALGMPLLIGLPTLGLLLAALGYATVQLLWLAPAHAPTDPLRGVTVAALSDPAATAQAIGRAATTALRAAH